MSKPSSARKMLSSPRSPAHRSPRPIVSSAVGVVVLLLRRIDVVLLLLLVTATRIRTRTGVPWRRRFAAPLCCCCCCCGGCWYRVHAVVVRVVRHVVRHGCTCAASFPDRCTAARTRCTAPCCSCLPYARGSGWIVVAAALLLLDGVGGGRRLLVVGGIRNAVVRTVAA